MKWSGFIGFSETVEKSPGVWVPQITKRKYKGELIRNSRRLATTDQLNDNITISNDISIIADPYINENLYSIKYVEFRGMKLKVTNADVQYPRLVLSLGGLYNVD